MTRSGRRSATGLWMVAVLGALSASTGTAVGCGSSSGGGGGGGGATGDGGTNCSPGASVSCVGPGGCAGGQVCSQDGSGYGACDCGLQPEGGSSEGGSHDASSGSSSGGADTGADSTTESGGSSGGSSGSSSGGGTDSGPETSVACSNGTDCTTCVTNATCSSCCETAHMEGYSTLLPELVQCACTSPGVCTTECATDLCGATQRYPDWAGACGLCISNNAKGACATVFQGCMKDPDCVAFQTCAGGCPK